MDFYRALWPTLEFDKDIHDSPNPNPTCIIDTSYTLNFPD